MSDTQTGIPVLPTKKALDESLCAMQLLRMLGFPSDNLYLVLGTKEEPGMIRIAIREPGNSFSIPIGITMEAPEEFQKKWEVAATAWNAMDSDAALQKFNHSTIHKEAPSIVASLLKSGFRLNTEATR